MEPILLLHGYSSEGKSSSPSTIRSIYGDLPDQLRDRYGNANVLEIDLSRYVSMDDALSIDDITRAMDRVLRKQFPHLLSSGFNIIAHSTGALVARSWIRRYWQEGQCPARRCIYLAGAHFGSGWAHVGRTQLAKYLRAVFQGAERGVRVLSALEFGSSWTIEMHLELDRKIEAAPPGNRPLEFCLVGSQYPDEFSLIPVGYAHEDGSDGVVRAAAANLNYSYVRVVPKADLNNLAPADVKKLATSGFHLTAGWLMKTDTGSEHYRVDMHSQPGAGQRRVPFAVIFEASHSFKRHSIVDGEFTRPQVIAMLNVALGATEASYEAVIQAFNDTTSSTYQQARVIPDGKWPSRFSIHRIDRQKQYDKFAQIVFRVFDQDGSPFSHFNLYLNSFGAEKPKLLVNELFEDGHGNGVSKNTITFYLRLTEWNEEKSTWVDRIDLVNGVELQIDAMEPGSGNVMFVPLRYTVSPEALASWLRPNATTIVDVHLFRVPADEVFNLVSAV